MKLTWFWRMTKRPPHQAGRLPAIPSGVRLTRQPVMSKDEAEFYNLLRLAVRDQYLVLAQVPIWCLVELSWTNEAAYRELMSKLALKRVDFVLAHPGTLAVEKVVELQQPGDPLRREERNRLLEAVFQQTGIQHICVPARSGYTLPDLATLLGLDPLE
jgi:hypothetical protein